MRKLLNKPWFVAVLAVAAVAFVAVSLYDQMHPAGSGDAAATASAWVEPDPAGGEDGSLPPAEGQPRTPREALLALVLPKSLGDPFAPRPGELEAAQAPEAAAPDRIETLLLSAIWKQGEILLVLVNGEICEPGDAVGTMTIESADAGGIWISHPRGRDFVEIGREFTLVTPASRPTETPLALHEG